MEEKLNELIEWFRRNITEYGIDVYSDDEIDRCSDILHDYCSELENISLNQDDEAIDYELCSECSCCAQ